MAYKTLLRSSGANVAMTAALCLVPLSCAVGLAIDTSRVFAAKQELLHVLDSAVLAGARAYIDAGDIDDAARKEAAETTAAEYLSANLAAASSPVTAVQLALSWTDDRRITASASGKVPLFFGGLFNMEVLDIEVTSQAQGGDARVVEIVLALDNTASMFNSGRFDLMRDAAKGFVDTVFEESIGDDSVRIGVLPWTTVVSINSEAPGAWDPKPPPQTNPPAAGSKLEPASPFEDRREYALHPETLSPITGADLDALFEPVGWRGCIRSALNERQVNGAGVVSFPLTDDPVANMKWPAALIEMERQTIWVNETPPPPPPPPPPPRSNQSSLSRKESTPDAKAFSRANIRVAVHDLTLDRTPAFPSIS